MDGKKQVKEIEQPADEGGAIFISWELDTHKISEVKTTPIGSPSDYIGEKI